MYLNENLHICLLAIENRYPHHTIDLNTEIIEMPDIKTEDWTAEELVAFFSENALHLLQGPAYLNIDACSCEMYLPLRSTGEPAFFIHCRGKIPDHHAIEGRSTAYS